MFKDIVCSEEILRTDDPRRHKSLGRHCEGYVETEWREAGEKVMKDGIMAKVCIIWAFEFLGFMCVKRDTVITVIFFSFNKMLIYERNCWQQKTAV